MSHYLDYMDKEYKNVIEKIKRQHTYWKIDKNFVIYRKITPVTKGVNFTTTIQLRKKNRTSVILEQDFNGRKTKHYFSDYNIIKALCYIYDSFIEAGDVIYDGMCKLIEDSGTDVNFRIGTEQYSFKGIEYLSNDIPFFTFTDYLISINDFIALLNLVIEKERYSKESDNGKGTIGKYITFLKLCSNRTLEYRSRVINILTEENLYKGNSLDKYEKIINKTGEAKLYFDTELFANIL